MYDLERLNVLIPVVTHPQTACIGHVFIHVQCSYVVPLTLMRRRPSNEHRE